MSVFDQRLWRTSYLVIPRLALESMPVEWQKRFEAMLKECDATGIETPDYHVLRDDPEYTLAERNNSHDEASDLRYFSILRPDPWANYRRGKVPTL